MHRKYIIALLGVLCGLILGISLFIINNNKAVEIKPMEAFKQKEKVSFISSWGAYDSKAPRIKTLFKRLAETYDYLEIEDSSMAGSEFLFILKTDFANGNEPDIFGLWPGSDINLLINQGKVADLSDVLKEDTDWYNSFNEATWDYVTTNNHIYGLPIEMIYEGLFVNKDLFEAYHVKVPTNYEELLKAVKSFKKYGIVPIAYNQTPEGSYIYQNMVMKIGGKEDAENPFDENNQIKPCFVKGLYYMKELYDAGAFPDNWHTLDDKARNELFLQKKAAMIVQGSWFIGDNVLKSNDATVDIVPFPSMPGGKADASAIIYGCGNGIFHMSQKAWDNEKQRKNCLMLLKKLTSPEYISEFAKDSGFISNIELGEYAPEDTVMSIKGTELITGSSELVGAVDWFIDRNIWENVIIKQFPDVLKGKKTPEALYDDVSNMMDKKG